VRSPKNNNTQKKARIKNIPLKKLTLDLWFFNINPYFRHVPSKENTLTRKVKERKFKMLLNQILRPKKSLNSKNTHLNSKAMPNYRYKFQYSKNSLKRLIAFILISIKLHEINKNRHPISCKRKTFYWEANNSVIPCPN
jgi:hypothetical protein